MEGSFAIIDGGLYPSDAVFANFCGLQELQKIGISGERAPCQALPGIHEIEVQYIKLQELYWKQASPKQGLKRGGVGLKPFCTQARITVHFFEVVRKIRVTKVQDVMPSGHLTGVWDDHLFMNRGAIKVPGRTLENSEHPDPAFSPESENAPQKHEPGADPDGV